VDKTERNLGERDEQAANRRHNDDANQPEWNVLRPEPNLNIRRTFPVKSESNEQQIPG